MSENKNKNESDKKRTKLTVSEESIGEVKAGTLTCKPLYNNATVIAGRSQCIQGSVTDVK